MAIYHLSVKPVSRAGGRSATAAAAYRSGSEIADRTTGQVFDYTRKRGIEHSEIVLPTEAAKRDINWARDRQQLWNAAEEAEKRKDARVAREYEVALPHELTRQQRTELVRAFSQEIANRYGNAVDFAIHAPHREGDQRNHHAHILSTTRQVEPTGLGSKTDIELKDADRAKKGLGPAKSEITEIRARWAALTNEYLASHGHRSRVDHRSLEAQGIDREPTVHKGPAVSGMERRGVATEVGFRIQQEAEARLARAAELGRLERESQEIRSEIVTLSTDIAAALRARAGEGTMPKQPTKERPASAAAIAAQAREQWLAEREAQRLVKADDAALDARLQARREPAASKGVDEERQAAIERWKSMVNGAAKGDGRGVSHDDGEPPGPDRGKGRAGPDNDHGL